MVAFGGLLLFRHPLKKVVTRLTRFEGFGVSGEFGEALEQAENEVSELPAPAEDAPTTSPGEPPHSPAREILLAKTAPGAAVVTAWIAVEKELERIVGEYIGSDKSYRRTAIVSPRDLDELVIRGVIPVELSRSLLAMKRLRNMAAHGAAEPSTVEAVAYQQLAGEVLTVLASIGPKSDALEG